MKPLVIGGSRNAIAMATAVSSRTISTIETGEVEAAPGMEDL
jgi:hypothetical protein